jgi:predicted RNA-binding Zn ribbon-like protein
MSISPSNQILLGGAVCLDFVNTRAWKPDQPPHDSFSSYLALLQWGLQLELVSEAEAENMLAQANQHAGEAQSVLQQAVFLRGVIYNIFSNIATGQATPDNDLDSLNTALANILPRLQVIPGKGGFAWKWSEDPSALDRVLWPVLYSAAELLVSDKLERIRRCDGCGWLFLDATKAGNRRWCDMRICGNRAKVRRHYAREKRARQA